MSLIVKICGLKTPDALDAALDSGADMVGFVFFPPSPRHLKLEAARVLGKQVNNRATKVALTVNASDDTMREVVDALNPQMLQLHGSEIPDRVADIKRRFGLPVIKALPIEAKDDLAKVKDYSSIAEWIMFDARAPKDATRPGGLGKPFDWTLLRAATPGVPFILSGGLTAKNVGEALAITLAPAVDVSSGVEKAPGEKDPEMIREFIEVARAEHIKATTFPYRVSL
jgi:phosphoribosylanthranilate isomerase